MSDPIELRCSGLPLAFICPGSVRPEGLVIHESSESSALGNAVHEGLAVLVETGAVPWGETGALVRRFELDDEQELQILLALGARLWRELNAHYPMPNASAEHALTYRDPAGRFVLTGHLDAVAWLGPLVRVADHKTGRLDSDYREQLRGYCVLALAAGEAFGTTDAEAFALWVRDREIERHRMRRDEVRGWLDDVRRRIVEWDGVYHASTQHCPRCPRSHECPAGRAIVRRDVEAVTGDESLATLDDDALDALGPDGVVALLAKADLARNVGGRVRDAIRAYVLRRGDVVGGGQRLTVRGDERRELDVLSAFEVLNGLGFTDDEYAEIITLSIAAAERVVAKRVKRGKGAEAKRALVAALDDAGAIKVNVTPKLVVTRE
jgi:hypothetical protein